MQRAAALTAGTLAVILLPASWIAAFVVGGYVEYLGWRQVIVDGRVVAGLAVAVLAAPPAFMLAQTVVSLPAAALDALSARLQNDERPGRQAGASGSGGR